MNRDRYLLDTSALLAHFRGEPGFQLVEDILEDHPEKVRISSLGWLEFHLRLQELVPNPASHQEALDIYQELLSEPLPVTGAVARVALELKRLASERIPNGDALIAATAKLDGATLVHRDPHLALIPATALAQLVLPPRN